MLTRETLEREARRLGAAKFGIGDDYYGEDMPIFLTGKFGVNF